MREYAKKPESLSRTLDSSPKASRQAPIDVILQRYKERNIQRFAEDEDLIQGKFDTVQRAEIDEYEVLQDKFEPVSSREHESMQREEKNNNTGLPDNLKTGIENFSGYSLDDVRVHYNSPKPAQLQALAYAQGTDIHVGPGQEKHLPHEAWHVVQQMPGRVQPTMQLQGLNVNDNEGLESEADRKGNKILIEPDAVQETIQNFFLNHDILQFYSVRNIQGWQNDIINANRLEGKNWDKRLNRGVGLGAAERQRNKIIIAGALAHFKGLDDSKYVIDFAVTNQIEIDNYQSAARGIGYVHNNFIEDCLSYEEVGRILRGSAQDRTAPSVNVLHTHHMGNKSWNLLYLNVDGIYRILGEVNFHMGRDMSPSQVRKVNKINALARDPIGNFTRVIEIGDK